MGQIKDPQRAIKGCYSTNFCAHQGKSYSSVNFYQPKDTGFWGAKNALKKPQEKSLRQNKYFISIALAKGYLKS